MEKNIKDKEYNKNDEEDSFIAATKLNIKRKISCVFEDDLIPRKKEKLQLQEIKRKKTTTNYHHILSKIKNNFTSI